VNASLRARCGGFSLIEAMVGMVIGTLVLAGAYSLWLTHQDESYRLGKKIDVRNQLALSSKRLQRSITLAGLGLGGAGNLAKDDAVGSDTLIIFLNTTEQRSTLSSDASHTVPVIHVDDPTPFAAAEYLAISFAGHGEIRRIVNISGSDIYLDTAFASDYPMAGSLACPASRERFYSDQDSTQFVREFGGNRQIMAKSVKNFQVSFGDKNGAATEVPAEVRTVRFSLTGIYPAKQGALNSIVISSTAIPRNML
jgi:hypothetical protein